MSSPFAQLNPGDTVIRLAKTAAKFSLLGLVVGVGALVYFVATDTGGAGVIGALAIFFGAVVGAVIGFVGFIGAAGVQRFLRTTQISALTTRIVCALVSALCGGLVLLLMTSSLWTSPMSTSVVLWSLAAITLALAVAFYLLNPIPGADTSTEI